ncbi:hypothetical protein [Streptomyces sp. NPDC086023]|uniref:hypothetical protein n=1 Tax=Streptomyces sp. NPDC086023 TaxID=3365746 RepID=UPI0037D82ABE
MGGGQHIRHGRTRRHVALLCALGTLLAALFLCTGTGSSGPVRDPGGAVARHAAEAHRAAYVCPYDLPGCSPFSHLTPGVLTAPPPAAALPAVVPPPAGPDLPAGRRLPPEPSARAPDLHVLQVLRT